MKILMINKFLHPNGGSETYIFRLGEHLRAIGHEVQFFGMEHEGRIVGNRVEAYTSNMDFHNGSKIGKILYPIRTIYSAEARRKIRAVLEDFQPDVCHLNNFNYQLTPSIILEIVKWRRQTGRKCRILYTAHDYQLVCPNHMCNNPVTGENCEKCLGGRYIHCLKGKCIHGSTAKSAVGMAEAMFWRWQGAYRHIDKVICCSEFLQSKMNTHPVFAGKTVAMHNFVEPAVDKACQKQDYVLYFGRLSEEKGTAALLEACKNLPEIPFVFAGTGPMQDRVQGGNITYVGFKTGEELDNLIRGARMSVYPSQWYENCPFSVMESLMMGTPVMGADIGGIPELVRAGETGELFPAGDVQALTAAIRNLWNDREKLHRYSENCRRVQFDSVAHYTDKLMKLYGE